MNPKKIGIRQAKIQLSKLIKIVKDGKEVILTDRGQPVGKIVPIETQSLPLEARIRKLEDQGFIESPYEKRPMPLPQPIPVPGEVAQKFLREDRDSGK